MNKTIFIFKYEIINTIFRKSFLTAFFLFPFISLLLYLSISAIEGGQTRSLLNRLFSTNPEIDKEGFVDPADLIRVIPDELTNHLYEYPDEKNALFALENGFISSYYVIDPDYIETGKITVVRTDFNPFGGILSTPRIQRAITYNLLQENTNLYYRFYNIVDLDAMILSQTPPASVESPPPLEKQLDPSQTGTFLPPYLVGMLFYIVVMGSSSLMLSSVNKERSNLTLEVLLTSISPLQLLSGKIFALGLIGLGQTILWGSFGFAFLNKAGDYTLFGQIYQLPVPLLLWGMVFFLLGYAIFASLMAGIGALLPYLREIYQITSIVLIPLVIPIMLINTTIMRPNSTIAIILSLFPLTSPVGMMTRMAVTTVPTWQILLSVLILLITAIITIWGVSKLFRAQILLRGQEIRIITRLRKIFLRENLS